MVYRKTEKVIARANATRDLLIASAIDVLAKSGLEGYGLKSVMLRAGCSAGLLYNYFPDVNELLAAALAQILARDLDVILDAAKGKEPRAALVAAITALLTRHSSTRLTSALAVNEIYGKGVRDELETLIRASVDIPPKQARLAARAILGLIMGLASATGPVPERASVAVLFALRGIGARVPATT